MRVPQYWNPTVRQICLVRGWLPTCIATHDWRTPTAAGLPTSWTLRCGLHAVDYSWTRIRRTPAGCVHEQQQRCSHTGPPEPWAPQADADELCDGIGDVAWQTARGTGLRRANPAHRERHLVSV